MLRGTQERAVEERSECCACEIVCIVGPQIGGNWSTGEETCHSGINIAP